MSALKGNQQPPTTVVTPQPQTPTPTPQPEPTPAKPEATPTTTPTEQPQAQTTKPSSTPTPAKPETKPEAKPETKPEVKPTKPEATKSAQTTQEPETIITLTPTPQTDPNPNQSNSKPVPAPPKVASTPAPGSNTVSKPTTTSKPSVQINKPTPSQVSKVAEPGGSWRIAVGSFSDTANASRMANGLRAKGYPVSLEPSGGNTRVWVGPYASSSRARAVAGTLGGYGPQVARLTASQTPTPSQAAPTPEPTPAQTSTSSTGGYLQAGAFRNQQNAQDMATKIQQAGFPASVSEGNGIYRVRVGPVDNTSTAKSALRAKGIAAVEVR